MGLPKPALKGHRAEIDGLSTRAVHAGRSGKPGEPLGSTIVQTSSFVLESPESCSIHHDYGRVSNETVALLEAQLRALEASNFAPAFANGIAAVNAIFSLLKSGDSILFEANTYGCTLRLVNQIYRKFDITTSTADFTSPTIFDRIRAEKPTLIWIESPTNPLLKILDIEGISAVAREVGAQLVVDNTFASPVNQRPLSLGADMALYSLTKYHSGHSTTMGGVVCTNNELLGRRLYDIRKFNGAILSPAEASLTSQSVQSIELRMERCSSSALQIASFLEEHPQSKRVLYPMLASHPQHALAVKQMKTGSGIIAAEFDIKKHKLNEFIAALNPYFLLSHSLGSTKSQVSIPALMSHGSLSVKERSEMGLSDTLLRLSIGIENPEDLIRVLDIALNTYKN